MDRLGFTLPDFCRVSWASTGAQARWAPVVRRAAALCPNLELASLREGLRQAALITIHRNRMADFVAEQAKAGLTVSPLHSFRHTGYVSDLNPSNQGGDLFMCAVGTPATAAAAEAAYRAQSNKDLAALLGYPSCCSDFFDEVWGRQRWIDTTWPMAVGAEHCERAGAQEIDLQGEPGSNLLFRWLGVRPVFHLPCSFHCAATHAVARDLRDLAHATGVGDDAEALYEMLAWPVQWSALHGIAEIETPVLRISTRTDATATRRAVRLHAGDGEVTDAPFGDRFPFRRRPVRNRRRAEVTAPSIQIVEAVAPPFTASGFRTHEAMELAFAPLLQLAAELRSSRILHLGCKDGGLLWALAAQDPALEIAGVDEVEARVAIARQRLLRQSVRVYTGQIDGSVATSELPRADICMIMVGRLLEIGPERTQTLMDAAARHGTNVVVYAFDDWLQRGDIETLAGEVGLALDRVRQSSAGACGLVTAPTAVL